MDKEIKQLSLLEEEAQTNNSTIVCLGMTFENDEKRLEYFRNELREKLPELKKIEGFPIGEDEDIIALSDPPYYTACPNPWINDFIKQWEREKNEVYERSENEEYHCEPLAIDVIAGKNDPIYNAHYYHTKVPYKAIRKYILHYTKPGDIVLDGFSGSGMTGIAAQMCEFENLDIDGLEVEEGTQYGNRNSILCDLSPNATFMAKNNNIIGRIFEVSDVVENIIQSVWERNLDLIQTLHTGWKRGASKEEERRNSIDSETEKKGIINYTVWSDVFICENCSEEMVYWDLVFNGPGKPVKKELKCTKCGVLQNKNKLIRKHEKKYIGDTGEIIDVAKQKPVLINYTYNGKRFEKYPDEYDINKILEVEQRKSNFEFNVQKIPEGLNTNQPRYSHGLQYNFQFFSDINLLLFNEIFKEINNSDVDGYKKHFLLYLLSACLQRTLKLNRYMPNHDRHVGPLSGTLYISQLTAEIPLISYISSKWKDLKRCGQDLVKRGNNVITTQSTGKLEQIPDNSIDYIFTDPPFGENLNYSELNSIWESFIGITTNIQDEAIMNSFQKKGINEYQGLIEKCFKQMFRILKPGRWITVEFHNSKNSVWNSIQEALSKVGFIIADVRVLDKKKGTTKQMSYMTTAKQDLVISAYKPKQKVLSNSNNDLNVSENVWIFVENHLNHLPVFIKDRNGVAEIVIERTPRVLFDRMVAYYVQNGLVIPISSAEFQSGVEKRFPMRDGMAFLEKQVAEYDKKRLMVKEFAQMSLFVSDENSAIEWIRQKLLKKPQTRQDIYPNYMKEIQHIAKHELLPELDDLLYQNFLSYEGDIKIPDQIVSYLRRNYKDLRGLNSDDPVLIEKAMNRWYVPDPNKQADLEKLREKALLREFNGYIEELENNKKKLKQFRTEAIRAGFKKAYSEKEFERIVKVGERLPEQIIQEDDKLLMYYDNACIRLGL
ncbi:TPA: DNA methyltransferase [Bacillus cereus]